ncbi:hypothetical protein HG530_001599 [Fusarium avenaceum]|nr:hypothetical protein HG530_001599 [Fusarium avenaceum]
MTGGRQVDNTRGKSRGGVVEESGFEQLEEEEVREVVCAKLELMTINGVAVVRDSHDTGIVDQTMDLGGLAENGSGGSTHRG